MTCVRRLTVYVVSQDNRREASSNLSIPSPLVGYYDAAYVALT